MEEAGQYERPLPRSFLRPCILLSLKEGAAHGYDMQHRLSYFGFSSDDHAALYRGLRAMEKERLVSSVWETSHIGPPRRRYVCSLDGEAWLRAWVQSLRESQRFVSRFLRRYEQLSV